LFNTRIFEDEIRRHCILFSLPQQHKYRAEESLYVKSLVVDGVAVARILVKKIIKTLIE